MSAPRGPWEPYFTNRPGTLEPPLSVSHTEALGPFTTRQDLLTKRRRCAAPAPRLRIARRCRKRALNAKLPAPRADSGGHPPLHQADRPSSSLRIKNQRPRAWNEILQHTANDRKHQAFEGLLCKRLHRGMARHCI